MDYINGLNLWLKVECSQWEAQMKGKEKVEKLAFIHVFLSQWDSDWLSPSLIEGHHSF